MNLEKEGIDMAESVFNVVKGIILDNIKYHLQKFVPPEKVTMEADIVDDLGGDSLMATSIILDLECYYNRDFPDDIDNVSTVGDLVRYIEDKLTRGRSSAEEATLNL